MKDIIKLFLLIIFLQFNQVYAAENIVYLDIEKLIHSSQAGKIINENIKKNHKTNLDIFEKKENELKEEESKIIAQKNILNEEEFKKKIDNSLFLIELRRKMKSKKIIKNSTSFLPIAAKLYIIKEIDRGDNIINKFLKFNFSFFKNLKSST